MEVSCTINGKPFKSKSNSDELLQAFSRHCVCGDLNLVAQFVDSSPASDV